MKIVISPDSFKGTLTAVQAAESIERGIKRIKNDIETCMIPVADGGEGTVETLVLATNGHKMEVPVLDPLGREIIASYGVLGNGTTCVVEMAVASGITLLHNNERNPQIASTFGTGQLLKHALQQGFKDFIVCIGGSATNDAGVGMLRALGLQLLDKYGRPVQKSIDGLYQVETLNFSEWDERIRDCTFTIACDVDNPLVGNHGATTVFGPQKGVKLEEIAYFDEAITHFADVVEQQLGIRLHDYKGAGAAGGMGGALIAFLNGQFRQGIELVLEVIDYRQKIAGAHYVITGEGKSDQQTLHGKAPIGIWQCASEQNILTVLLSGAIDEQARAALQKHFAYIAAVVGEDITVDMALEQSAQYLTERTARVFTQLLG